MLLYATRNSKSLWFNLLITAKGQLISKGLFAVFICTKNEQKYFSISALKIYCSKIILSWVRAHSRKYFFSSICPFKMPFNSNKHLRLWTFHTIKLTYVICKTSYFRKNIYISLSGARTHEAIYLQGRNRKIFSFVFWFKWKL